MHCQHGYGHKQAYNSGRRIVILRAMAPAIASILATTLIANSLKLGVFLWVVFREYNHRWLVSQILSTATLWAIHEPDLTFEIMHKDLSIRVSRSGAARPK